MSDPTPLNLELIVLVKATLTDSDERIRGLGMVHALVPLDSPPLRGQVEIVSQGTVAALVAEVERLRAVNEGLTLIARDNVWSDPRVEQAMERALLEGRIDWVEPDV